MVLNVWINFINLWIQIFISIINLHYYYHLFLIYNIFIAKRNFRKIQKYPIFVVFKTFTFTFTLYKFPEQKQTRKDVRKTYTFNQREGRSKSCTPYGCRCDFSRLSWRRNKGKIDIPPRIRGNPIHLYESVSLPTRLPVVEAWKFWPRVGGHSNSAFASRVFY